MKRGASSGGYGGAGLMLALSTSAKDDLHPQA